jgi:hypothetical protein
MACGSGYPFTTRQIAFSIDSLAKAILVTRDAVSLNYLHNAVFLEDKQTA